MTKYMKKDVDSTLDYTFNWANWLDGSDTIANSTVDVPEGLTKGSETFSDTAATVWISGGTVGQVYLVQNTITTALGRIEDAGIELEIVEED